MIFACFWAIRAVIYTGLALLFAPKGPFLDYYVVYVLEIVNFFVPECLALCFSFEYLTFVDVDFKNRTARKDNRRCNIGTGEYFSKLYGSATDSSPGQ